MNTKVKSNHILDAGEEISIVTHIAAISIKSGEFTKTAVQTAYAILDETIRQREQRINKD